VDFDVVYNHMKHYYMRRIMNSDVRAGTYVMVVAEGIRGEDDKVFSEGDGTDSFGHVKLTGAARFIRKRLEDMMKQDPEIRQFMKVSGMFVPGVFEIPEVREVLPGHMVRSGATSAYDVNFGKEIGAAAVILLEEGLSGVTVVEINDGKIRYIKTTEAIVQRFVNLSEVSFYEQMDVCFGRKPQQYVTSIEKYAGPVERFM
jgi:6-phosphofructokinase 1